MSESRTVAIPVIAQLTAEETERFAAFFPDGMDDPEWPDYSLRLAKLKGRGVSLADVGVVLEATPRYGPAWHHERHAEKEFFLQRERRLRTLLKECQAEVRWRFMLDEAPLHLEDGTTLPFDEDAVALVNLLERVEARVTHPPHRPPENLDEAREKLRRCDVPVSDVEFLLAPLRKKPSS